MKIAPMGEVRHNFAKYLVTAEEEPVFVSRNGKIAAVIEHIDDRDIEDYLLERSPASASAGQGQASAEPYVSRRIPDVPRGLIPVAEPGPGLRGPDYPNEDCLQPLNPAPLNRGITGQPALPVSTHWVARCASSAADSRFSLFLMCSQWDSIVLMLRWRVSAIWRVRRP